MIGNILKAAVATALTPVAVVIDVVRLPVTSSDPHLDVGPFDATGYLCKAAKDNIKEALR